MSDMTSVKKHTTLDVVWLVLIVVAMVLLVIDSADKIRAKTELLRTQFLIAQCQQGHSLVIEFTDGSRTLCLQQMSSSAASSTAPLEEAWD